MNPIANFLFSVNGLTVNISDKSQNIPTSWLWDFGDSLGTDTIQNPVYVYSVPGNYTITLTVQNAEGNDTIQYPVSISQTGAFDIDTIVTQQFPIGYPLNLDFLAIRKKYWQIYLQTLIDPHIPDAYLYDENYWPSLVNMLIAQLIIYDAVIKIAQDAQVLILNSAGGTVTEPGSGAIKNITTGPSSAEWYDSNETIKIILGSSKGGQGMFDLAAQEACNLASRIRVTLPMCPPLVQGPQIPIKVGASRRPTAIQFLEAYYSSYPDRYIHTNPISHG